ncbi:ABC transporter permease [Bacteroides sp. 214]|uniref:ABC transporter permease n=1 Tax=Bacteroides sp. 214 TaxID=2302935 RepID=UPI0013D52723|nr:ABC transporter permease [Bacteroides sp. 214]NDW13577.1 ABC transporter permease [Bacteroides sp. 214]
MILHYLKIAFRNLLKYKTQSTISVIGLAIGFTAFVLGSYWYYWEHTFDTFHPDWKHTYMITTSGISKTADGKDLELSQLHEEVRSHFATFPEIEQMCATSEISYRSDGKEKSWMGLRADSAFFSMFQATFKEGSIRGNAYNGKSVLLTEKTARFIFGDSLCTDKRFQVNEHRSFHIAGVIRDYPQNTNFKFDYIVLGEAKKNNQGRNTVYVRVNPHADINLLRQKIESYRLDKVATPYSKPAEWRFHLRSLPEVHFCCNQHLSARFRNINILAFAGLLAFVSALMNLLVLFIGQQQRKLGTNLTFRLLGASLRGLTGKKLIELLLPLLFAFLLALALIELIFPYYQQYTRIENDGFFTGINHSLEREDIFLASVVIAALSVVVFLVVSLFPILVLLKQKKGHVASRFFRNGLITGQIFIGSLLLITSLCIYGQFSFMSNTDKGIKTENIWQIDLGFSAANSKDCRPFKEALQNNPYIEDVTGLVMPVLSQQGGDNYCTFISHLMIEGRDMEENSKDYLVIVDPNFLSFFGLQMKEGEWITNLGTYDYVVNETGARMLGEGGQVGRRINKHPDNPMSNSICGVMKDFYYSPMQYPIDKLFFAIMDEVKYYYSRQQYFYIKVQPQNKEKALAFARSLYKEYEKEDIDPSKQFIYLPDLVEEFSRDEKTMSSIFTLLALICILISSFGIYSLVSLSAEQRKKEIAIRKVNGAVFRDILQLFLRSYLWQLVVGNALALSLGYVFVQHWLETYAYRVNIHAGYYVAVFVVTGLLVVLSVAVQVRRAAAQNPAESIKEK